MYWPHFVTPLLLLIGCNSLTNQDKSKVIQTVQIEILYQWLTYWGLPLEHPVCRSPKTYKNILHLKMYSSSQSIRAVDWDGVRFSVSSAKSLLFPWNLRNTAQRDDAISTPVISIQRLRCIGNGGAQRSEYRATSTKEESKRMLYMKLASADDGRKRNHFSSHIQCLVLAKAHI